MKTRMETYNKYYKGLLIQVQNGWQALQQLRETEAAQAARKARRSVPKRVIQKGGILTASHARWKQNKQTVAQVVKERFDKETALLRLRITRVRALDAFYAK